MKSTIDTAVKYLLQQGDAPAAEALLEALLAAEKQARGKVRHDYSQLLGSWRLGFITGTQKTRQRASGLLGAGRFLPRWLNIQLTYSADSPSTGRVKNSVKVGPLSIQLAGPTQFYPKTNSLAFDFTQMQLGLGGATLYNGFVQDGERRESQFYQQTLKEQAFFTYFWVETDAIAARGRGGGLALWVRQ